MPQPNRLKEGGLISRKHVVTFFVNGLRVTGYAGDTLASALLANKFRIVGRSFKYHRPRGILGSGAEEPNALFQIGDGDQTIPNVKATQIKIFQGMVARSVNCWPSADFDFSVVIDKLGGIFPAGFYYKTFMWPKRSWKTYEYFIRRSAGLGVAPNKPDPDRYDHQHAHCDVLVIGGGASGLISAHAAGLNGARVILCHDQISLGGSMIARNERINGGSALQWVNQTADALRAMPEVRIVNNCVAYGHHHHNFITARERVAEHLHLSPRGLPRERIWKIYAKQVILATGAIERPLVFSNNDRPGVMLASAVSTYLNLFAVAPGKRCILFCNNDEAYRTACDLVSHGREVLAIIDPRSNPDGDLPKKAKKLGIRIESNSVVCNVLGRRRVKRVVVAPLANTGLGTNQTRIYRCDLLAVSGGWSPAIHLYSQAGGVSVYNPDTACFQPGKPVANQFTVGSCNGSFSSEACFREGSQAGMAAAAATGCSNQEMPPIPEVEPERHEALMPLWSVPEPAEGKGKQFVDFQNDTSVADLQLAVREGLDSIEHIKRYTALGFGTDQGKTGNINGAGIVANLLGKDIGKVGTTTFRPNYEPISFGSISGRNLGADFFAPVRYTPIQPWHVSHGAIFEDVGEWKRPWYYPRPGENMHQAVNRECLAARQSVAVLDASTLGKIDIKGPDASKFLNLIYINNWLKLGIGQCRYGLMLGEDGMIMDDGVTSCVAENHYHMTTTTGGAARVMAWMERWLQTEWPELKVYLTSVTDHWGVIQVSGPQSRQLLSEICTDLDFSNEEFPFMRFQDGRIAGIETRIFRISFTGELSYEINLPANQAHHVWKAVFVAGEKYNITPFGTESMHVLRAEKGFIIVGQDTDGSVTPDDVGMGRMVSRTKDFIGRRSLDRPDCQRKDRKRLVGVLTEEPGVVLEEGAQLVAEPNHSLPHPMLGHVTSSYFSANLGHSIALALLKDGEKLYGRKLYAPMADGRIIQVTVTKPIFYDQDGNRQKG